MVENKPTDISIIGGHTADCSALTTSLVYTELKGFDTVTSLVADSIIEVRDNAQVTIERMHIFEYEFVGNADRPGKVLLKADVGAGAGAAEHRIC